MATYPNTGQYDLDLASSGDGWCGTFNGVVRYTVQDILSDGEPFGPVEVTLSDGTVFTGVLAEWMGDDNFTVTEPDELPRIVEVDDVVRFRA